MKTIDLRKRLFIYIIDMFLYSGLAFLSICPFIFICKIDLWIDILMGIGFVILYSFVFTFLLLKLFRGYTIISAIFGAKVVGVEEKKITTSQALVRALNQSLWIILLFDIIYLLANKTQRGVIDRLTDTFVVDMRY